MRILWLDQTESPWKQADGWTYLNDYEFEFVRVADSTDARAVLQKDKDIRVAVINADIWGALELVTDIKQNKFHRGRLPMILVSAKWGKRDFKAHSLSPNAADNYARLPMPATGFVDVVSGLTETPKEQLLRSAGGNAAPPDLSAEVLEPTNQDDPSDLIIGGLEPPPVALKEDNAPKSPLQAIREAIKGKLRKDEENPHSPRAASVPESANVDVLKKYLEMRGAELEQALRAKNHAERTADDLAKDLERFKRNFRDLERAKKEVDAKLGRLEKKHVEQERQWLESKEKAGAEKEVLLGRIKILEEQALDAKLRYDGLKDRVRRDIRKIQTREKELETRLELVKRDSESLLAERDRQVVELKRKIDALEFDLDLIQDRKIQAENDANRYVNKLSRVARTLELAFGMLEEQADDEPAGEPELAPIRGGAADRSKNADIALVDQLLKKPPEELNREELAAAEAPTQIFIKEGDANQLLTQSGEEEGGENSPGGEFGQALGS